MNFKVGDLVQLKEPITGRRFKGKVKSIKDGKMTVSLANGLYVIYSVDKWELVEEESD